jgi:uncharacterized OB-fold protein
MWQPEVPNSLGGDDPRHLSLTGSRCCRCGKIYFPARRNCPNCLTREAIEPVLLGNRGRLRSYSISQVAPPGYKTPHIQGYIDLDPEGPCIFSLLTDCGSPPKLRIGQAMQMVVVEKSGQETDPLVFGYRFKPVD